MTRKNLLHTVVAVAFAAAAATSAHASADMVHAITKVANPHGLSVQQPATVRSPLHLTSMTTAGLVGMTDQDPSALVAQGLYTFEILKSAGDWEMAAYLAAELKETVHQVNAVDARVLRDADLTLPEHVLPVVYPTHVLDGIDPPTRKAAVFICGIKAPSYSASTDPRLRDIGRELSRQCAIYEN